MKYIVNSIADTFGQIGDIIDVDVAIGWIIKAANVISIVTLLVVLLAIVSMVAVIWLGQVSEAPVSTCLTSLISVSLVISYLYILSK